LLIVGYRHHEFKDGRVIMLIRSERQGSCRLHCVMTLRLGMPPIRSCGVDPWAASRCGIRDRRRFTICGEREPIHHLSVTDGADERRRKHLLRSRRINRGLGIAPARCLWQRNRIVFS
jgi:hypothetical protein